MCVFFTRVKAASELLDETAVRLYVFLSLSLLEETQIGNCTLIYVTAKHQNFIELYYGQTVKVNLLVTRSAAQPVKDLLSSLRKCLKGNQLNVVKTSITLNYIPISNRNACL